MEIKTLTLLSVILYMGIKLVIAEELCMHMRDIPRRPKPDNLPEIDYERTSWAERPFIPAPERDDVWMGEYTSNFQIIYMHEEIQGDVPIAKLNYRGLETPDIIRPLMSGSFTMLGPELRNETDEWFLYITQRQDFETPLMRLYMLTIEIPGESVQGSITLQIVNIDDNQPIIHVVNSCEVPEHGEPRLTNCTYQVSDEDGAISISAMTFQIESDRDDDEVFYISPQIIQGQLDQMNITLGLNIPLNFETNALHSFRITAFDSVRNNNTAPVMVRVQNVDSRNPRWLSIFAVQQLDEMTEANFTIRAIDGDTDLRRPIYYRLDVDEDDKKYFDITTIDDGELGGLFHVFPIDRDALEREVFELKIVAYKSVEDIVFEEKNDVVIIIRDVNNKSPEPLSDVYSIEIDEETPLTLNFDEEFGFHDRDTGENARYRVHLESVNPPGAEEAFFIQPEVGYQRQTFIMGTADHSLLDYEVEAFQNIELRVVATDLNNPNLTEFATVHIRLRNWNDEIPIFTDSIKTVTIKETEGKDFPVGTMLARDRDIGDTVVHSIMGIAQNILNINIETGDIYVAVDNAFDYQRQNELLVQIQAEDTLAIRTNNTATAQLLIQLEDVNNVPPTLRLPRGSPQLRENSPQGYPVTQESQEITATDPDTTADLSFEIIWETSYATKQGREADPSLFHGCLTIETEYPDPNNRRSAVGRLFVNEIRDQVTIDYEEYDVLYLTVRVVDNNTEIGQNYDELTYTITIVDMNDNAPQWVDGTLNQDLRVRENSASNTIIGSIQAIDIDGPLYNQVQYTIRPKQDTPINLVKIDSRTGQIQVDADGAIDADAPRDNLYYTVIASDKCIVEDQANNCPPDDTSWETLGDLTIRIIDTNNKNPEAKTDRFETTVYIPENAKTGDEVVTIVSEDLDRDEIYKTVRYSINYAVNQRLRSFFSVDLDTGRVYVDLTADETLDRDGDEPTHTIFLTLIDNFYSDGDGNRNQGTTEVEVVLLDVNDNAPVLPSTNERSWSISENVQTGHRLSPNIHATDRDQPNTNNSRVGYEIVDLKISNRDIEIPKLFEIVHVFPTGNSFDVAGALETAMDLRGYWGTYSITIRAHDHGDPILDSEETYEITVQPYNFHTPVFVFPQDGTTVRLAKERAVVNGLLMLVNGDYLDLVQATDEDGLEAGRVTFDIIGDDAASHYFHVMEVSGNQGRLALREFFTDTIREFRINIRATDGGTDPGPLSSAVVLKAVFVPTQGEPIFFNNAVTVAFVESEVGLTESFELPHAQDPKNYRCENDCHDIFYNIIGGNEEGYFALDQVRNVLSLTTALNRTRSEVHVLQVAAANIPNIGSAPADAVLTVTVTVREANPRPNFERRVYTAGISTLDSANRQLLTVRATHSEGLPVTYSMDMSSMVVHESLENVRNSAFLLNSETGVLTLNMQPTASMHGMFEFNVIATDPQDAQDTAEVKIYLISSINRVYFTFVNSLQEIETNRDFIAQTFSAGFAMTCNIDQILPFTEADGVVRDDMVEVRAHFIRDDMPVTTDVIEDIVFVLVSKVTRALGGIGDRVGNALAMLLVLQASMGYDLTIRLRSDSALLRSIQRTLSTELLSLRDFTTPASPEQPAGGAQQAVYALAALSALLAALCLLLLLVYVFRTRTLNRRLQALSMTKYGSQESGLNRLVLKAPGTNKHAIEGSNPIWNEAIKSPDFDAYSEQSDDSDLIGIEDLPQFRNDYFPPADNDSVQDMFNEKLERPVATHNNNFGFNPTPFSKEFANRDFSRI